MSSAELPTPISSPPRRKVSQACEFCRARKFRCNGIVPCATCEQYGKHCIFAQKARKPRPSHLAVKHLQDRIRRLEEENCILRSGHPQPVRALEGSHTGRIRESENHEHERHSSFDLSDVRNTTLSQTEINRHYIARQNGTVEGYGFSSTLHIPEEDIETPELDVYVEGQLIRSDGVGPPEMNTLTINSCAARYQEQFNLLTKDIDFDGVDRTVAIHLLNLHWLYHHHHFPLIYRPAFIKGLCEGVSSPYYSKLLLNAIFLASSKLYRGPDGTIDRQGTRFLKRAKILLAEEMENSSVAGVAALVLMGSSLVSTGKQHLGWLYTGIGLRMATDLCLHLNVEQGFSAQEIEIRKRVFWSVYICDRLQSLYLGRPFQLRSRDICVPRDFQDWSEEYDVFSLPGIVNPEVHVSLPNPMHGMSLFKAMCGLIEILDRIIDEFYSFGSSLRTDVFENVRRDLLAWRKKLPQHLEISSSPGVLASPTIVSLHLNYHAFTILLHRPFERWRECADASTEITRLCEAHRGRQSLEQATYQFSYGLYCAAIVHIHEAKVNPVAITELAACLECLRETNIPNTGVSRSQAILQKLIEREGIQEQVENFGAVSYTLPETAELDWDNLDLANLFGICSEY